MNNSINQKMTEKLLFLREKISDPIILDTDMFITKCKWNHDGSVFALLGSTVLMGESANINVIQFFSPFGEVSCNFPVTLDAYFIN